jgi:hypothetical protein
MYDFTFFFLKKNTSTLTLNTIDAKRKYCGEDQAIDTEGEEDKYHGIGLDEES